MSPRILSVTIIGLCLMAVGISWGFGIMVAPWADSQPTSQSQGVQATRPLPQNHRQTGRVPNGSHPVEDHPSVSGDIPLNVDLPGDVFVTGIVVDDKNQPIEGVTVFFPRSGYIEDIFHFRNDQLLAYGYHYGEPMGASTFGRSQVVLTGKDGRFRVRWPRHSTDENEGSVSWSLAPLWGSIKKDSFEVEQDEDGAPLLLRVVHDRFLSQTHPVAPGGDGVFRLEPVSGVEFCITDEFGMLIDDCIVICMPLKRFNEFPCTSEGRLIYAGKPGTWSFTIFKPGRVSKNVDVTIPHAGLVSVDVVLKSGICITGRVMNEEGAVDQASVMIGDNVGHTTADGVFNIGPLDGLPLSESIVEVTHLRHQKLQKPLGASAEIGDLMLEQLPFWLVSVVDEAENPIWGARVLCENLSGTEGRGRFDFETDFNGMVRIYGKAYERVEVRHSHFPAHQVAGPVTIEQGMPPLKVVLRPGPTVRLRVRYASGRPASKVGLWLQNGELGMSRYFECDGEGVLITNGLNEGTYTISCPAQNPGKTWTREILGGVDLEDLILEDAGSLFGLVDPRHAGEFVLASNDENEFKAQVSADGAWEFHSLPPAAYRLVMSANKWSDNAYERARLEGLDGQPPITLSSGERKNVALEVPSGAKVVVKVVDWAGNKVEGSLTAIRESAWVLGPLDQALCSVEAEEISLGIYRFNALPAGQWRLAVNDNEMYVGRSMTLHVESGDPREILWQMTKPEASIKGRIKGVNEEGRVYLCRAGEAVRIDGEYTDDAGYYRFEYLEPGVYELLWDPLELYECKRLGLQETVGQLIARIEVKAGETDVGDWTPPPSVSLEGSILGGASSLKDAVAWCVVGGRVVSWSWVGSDGRFVLEQLPREPGEVFLGLYIGRPVVSAKWNGRDTQITLEVPGKR